MSLTTFNGKVPLVLSILSKPMFRERAFPKLLRIWNPVLAAEDTNTLFQAFRARRISQGGMKTIPVAGFIIGVLLLIMLLTSIFLMDPFDLRNLDLGALAVVIFTAFGILIGGAVLAVRIFHRRKYKANSRLGLVFGKGDYVEEAAHDVYLSGANGRDVMEAIYLEEQERAWWPLAVAFWLFFLLISYFVFREVRHDPRGWMTIVTLPLMTFFLFSFLWSAFAGLLHEIHVIGRYEYWFSEDGLSRRLSQIVSNAIHICVFCFGIVLYVMILRLIISLIGTSVEALFPVEIGTTINQFFRYFSPLLVPLFVTLNLWLASLVLRRILEIRCRTSFEEGRDYWDIFVRKRILGDEDYWR